MRTRPLSRSSARGENGVVRLFVCLFVSGLQGYTCRCSGTRTTRSASRCASDSPAVISRRWLEADPARPLLQRHASVRSLPPPRADAPARSSIGPWRPARLRWRRCVRLERKAEASDSKFRLCVSRSDRFRPSRRTARARWRRRSSRRSSSADSRACFCRSSTTRGTCCRCVRIPMRLVAAC